jgi:ATP-dependent Zn protease
MDYLIQLFISWGPMILLIGVWLYFMKRSGSIKQGDNMKTMLSYYAENIAEMKRINANLERIAATFEAREAVRKTNSA